MTPRKPPVKERYPADALVRALKGRTVVDASCDGEGVDDVRLLLDDGTTILIDAELNEDPESLALAEQLGRPPWPQLLVKLGGDELWPPQPRDASRVAGLSPG